MRILTSLILMAAGSAIIYYRFAIYDFTGEWEWANKYLNNTAVAITLIGMFLIGAGAAYPFGVFDDFSIAPTATSPSK